MTWRPSMPRSPRPSGAIDKPTLIVARTSIGRGSPNRAGTAKAHGEALGADEDQAHARRARLDARAFRDPRGRLHAPGTPRLAAPRPRRRGTRRWPPTRPHFPSWRPSSCAAARRSAQGLCADRRRCDGRCACQGRDGGLAQGQPARARSLHQGTARAARRLGRPDRLEPDQHHAAHRRLRFDAPGSPTAAATSTTACANSAWPR